MADPELADALVAAAERETVGGARMREECAVEIEAEVARLTKLGAKVMDRVERWVVMQAPTGQRFCVVRVQRDGFEKDANSWE